MVVVLVGNDAIAGASLTSYLLGAIMRMGKGEGRKPVTSQ
jgi:hypothetical protein